VNDTEDFQQAKELVSSINQQGGSSRQSGSGRPAPR
jgi:hypothetical protein